MSIHTFFNDKQYWIVRHILFWVFMYMDEFFSIFGITESVDFDEFIFTFLFDVWIVYFNLYYLIPKYFENGKIIQYIGLTALTVLANVSFSMASTYFYYYACCDEVLDFYDFFSTSLLTLGVLGVALTIKISKINYVKQRKLLTLQKLQMSSELNYLKKQINPHFLFNVLNNIYVQSKESPKDVPESIMQLSELMRYQTYDASKDTVTLSREIEFSRKYFELEKMRKENLDVVIKEQGNLNNIDLPPLIFLPFIENACKHSSRIYNQQEQILVSWARIENVLTFEIENTMGQKYQIVEGEDGGFGLDNITKRLNLIYPDRHKLSIVENNEKFKVHLEIQLSS